LVSSRQNQRISGFSMAIQNGDPKSKNVRVNVKLCADCQQELASIRIRVDGNDLIMESCDKCDKRCWHMSGAPIDLHDALHEVTEFVGKRR
jgi:hypothetical protein